MTIPIAQKCCFDKCFDELWICRRAVRGFWYSFCKSHFELVEKCYVEDK